MLTPDQLNSLLNDLESDRVEHTTSTNEREKFAKAICAFSNDMPGHGLPGYLLLGVDDDGRPNGLQVTDELLLTLSGIRDNGNIQPLPAMNVGKLSLPEGDVAYVEVLPSDLPPVRYNGITWIRVGPRKARASESEERILTERRTASSKSFDATPCLDCKMPDLLPDLFLQTYLPNAVAREVLEENNREIRQQLASLRFFDLEKDCATHAGVLLFSKDPLRYLPGAYVQFVRFRGTQLSDDAISERSFSGDLLTVLRELDSFLSLQIQTWPEPRTNLREEAVHDYSIAAIRELLMNAVMHRVYESNSPIRFYWFEGRVEIQNPGGLYGEATPENFPEQNAYRNPIIAEAMKSLGYVNRFGSGVLTAQKALAANGNPPAEFEFQSTYFGVTIRRRP